MAKQALRAIEEADRVLFLVDAREGLAPSDHFIAQTLRKLGKQVIVVANKAEGLDAADRGCRVPSARTGRAAGDFFDARRRRSLH